jgi:hypothetical protein
MSLDISLLDSKKHLRDTFSCGEESLDNYIKKRANQELKKLVSTTFVLIIEIKGTWRSALDFELLDQNLHTPDPHYPPKSSYYRT